jgi:hypothetical protein
MLRQKREKYIAYCVDSEIRKFNDNIINEACNKSSAAWKIIRDSTGKNKVLNGISQLSINGREEIIKLNIVNALNHSFLVPLPENTDENAYNFEIPLNQISFQLHPTCEAEVYAIISKFAPKKSSGWDGISVHTLKYIALQIVEPLSYLINTSFS